MGFFSWFTQDTNKSISNIHSTRERFTVYMHDNRGNKWEETGYDGYGVFGCKDYYELVAEMNPKKTKEIFAKRGKEYELRCVGIDLAYDDNHNTLEAGHGVIFPNLTEDKEWEWKDEAPPGCPYQGYFYY